MTDEQLQEKVRAILQLPYSRILIPQEGGGFSCEILEFHGCFAEGETADEAYSRLETAAESWLMAVLASGSDVPEPTTNKERRSFGGYLQLVKVAGIMRERGVTIDPQYREKLRIENAVRAYQRYGDFVEWKNYAGLPMPKWDDLPEKIRGAWVVAVNEP